MTLFTQALLYIQELKYITLMQMNQPPGRSGFYLKFFSGDTLFLSDFQEKIKQQTKISNNVFLFLLCLVFSLAGCVSFETQIKKPKLSQEQLEQMEQALSLMKDKEFMKAGSLYDQLSVSLTDSSAKIFMLFNAGVSYREAGACEKALLRQRSALDHSLKFPGFKSRSLLELSYIYECLGETEMTLLTLKDLKKFRNSLPWDWNHILYPARLSLAFSRWGNKTEADKYKSMSLKQILKYKKTFSIEKDMQEKISQIFYLMGRSYVKKERLNAPAFGQAFFYHQLFLLQAVFFKDKTWSKMAEMELQSLFKKLVFSISQLKDKDKYKKSLQEDLKIGRLLVEREKSKKWLAFYDKKSHLILKPLITIKNRFLKNGKKSAVFSQSDTSKNH